MTAIRWMMAGCLACGTAAHSGTFDWVVQESPSDSRTTVILNIPVSLQRLITAPPGVRCELRRNTVWGDNAGLYGYWSSPFGGLPFDSSTGNASTILTVRLEIRRSAGGGTQVPLDPNEPLHVQCRLLPPGGEKTWQIVDQAPSSQSANYVKSGATLEVSGQVPVGQVR